jgi:hypothetical protein
MNEQEDATGRAYGTAATDPGNSGTDAPAGANRREAAGTDRTLGTAENIRIGQLLARSAEAGRSDGGDEEGDDVDPEKGRPKWSRPDPGYQVEFLEMLGAKWFQPGQKNALKGIHNALRAGDIADSNVYLKCIVVLADRPARTVRLADVVLPLPRTWYDWRMAQAVAHHWSVADTLRRLLDRDKIIEHCNYQMAHKSKPSVKEEVMDGPEYDNAAALRRLEERYGKIPDSE